MIADFVIWDDLQDLSKRLLLSVYFSI